MHLRSLTLAVMFVSVLSAADPVAVGTWKFNPEKSKMPAEEAEKLKGRVVTFEVVGEKGMRMTTVNTITGAKLVSISQQDGKEYPYEGEPGMTSIFTRIDDGHGRRVFKRNGKIEETLEISHSPDGKTRMVARTGIRNGKPIPQPWVEVYDRQ